MIARSTSWVALAVCLTFGGGAVRAQTPADSARQVAEAYFAALAQSQWDRATALVDSASVERFRVPQIMMLLSTVEHRAEIRAVMSKSGSGGFASGESVSDTVIPSALLAKYGSWQLKSMRGAPTIAELASLTPRALYARALEGKSHFCFPGAPECFPNPDFEGPKHVIGVVIEGDTLAHVLHRREPDPRDSLRYVSSRPEIVELLHGRDGWRIFPGFGGPMIMPFDLIDDDLPTKPAKQPRRTKAAKKP